MLQIWMDHVTHINESCHTDEWGMLHNGVAHAPIQTCITHMYVQRYTHCNTLQHTSTQMKYKSPTLHDSDVYPSYVCATLLIALCSYMWHEDTLTRCSCAKNAPIQTCIDHLCVRHYSLLEIRMRDRVICQRDCCRAKNAPIQTGVANLCV